MYMYMYWNEPRGLSSRTLRYTYSALLQFYMYNLGTCSPIRDLSGADLSGEVTTRVAASPRVHIYNIYTLLP